MDSLPTELLERIFQSILNPFDVVGLMRVCKHWQSVLQLRDRGLFQPLAQLLNPMLKLDDSVQLAPGFGPWFNKCLVYVMEEQVMQKDVVIHEDQFESPLINQFPPDLQPVHSVGQSPSERTELTRAGCIYVEFYKDNDDEDDDEKDPENFAGVGVLNSANRTFQFLPCKQSQLMSGGVEQGQLYLDSYIPDVKESVHNHTRWTFPRAFMNKPFQVLEAQHCFINVKSQDEEDQDDGSMTLLARVQPESSDHVYPEFTWQTRIDSRHLVLVSVHCFFTVLNDEVKMYSIPECRLIKTRRLARNTLHSDQPQMYHSRDLSVCTNHLLWFEYDTKTLFACSFAKFLREPAHSSLNWQRVVRLDTPSNNISWGIFSHYWTKRFIYITGVRPGASYLCLVDIMHGTIRTFCITKQEFDQKLPQYKLSDPGIDENNTYQGGFWIMGDDGRVVHLTGKSMYALFNDYVSENHNGEMDILHTGYITT